MIAPTLFQAQVEIFFIPLFHDSFAKPFTGSTVPTFSRYGVSRSSLPNTLPFTANEKDPSASLGMTIREERVSQRTLYTIQRISIPYTVISSAARNLFRPLFPSSFAKPFTGSTAPTFSRYGVSHFSLSGTLPLIANEKDPSAPLGMTLREYRSLTLPIYFPCNNDTREAPSTFAALLFFMRRTTPLNPTT